MSDDAVLVERARSGDERAFEALVNRHAARVYNLALRVVGHREEAEDLAQETFVRAWRALPGFRSEARFGTWLYRIATNLCYSRLPRLRAEMAALDADDSASWTDEVESIDAGMLTEELRAHLHAAIADLPDGFRLLLTLRHLQQMSYADIAEATELPEGTVKSGLHRARAQLRRAVTAYTTGTVQATRAAGGIAAIGSTDAAGASAATVAAAGNGATEATEVARPGGAPGGAAGAAQPARVAAASKKRTMAPCPFVDAPIDSPSAARLVTGTR